MKFVGGPIGSLGNSSSEILFDRMQISLSQKKRSSRKASRYGGGIHFRVSRALGKDARSYRNSQPRSPTGYSVMGT